MNDIDALDDAPTMLWTRRRRARTTAAANDGDVLTADEVAAILRVDRKTVYDAAGRGEMPHRRLGKRMVFSRTALLEWLSCKGPSER
jgi:excisionase family DNA binding protein